MNTTIYILGLILCFIGGGIVGYYGELPAILGMTLAMIGLVIVRESTIN